MPEFPVRNIDGKVDSQTAVVVLGKALGASTFYVALSEIIVIFVFLEKSET